MQDLLFHTVEVHTFKFHTRNSNAHEHDGSKIDIGASNSIIGKVRFVTLE